MTKPLLREQFELLRGAPKQWSPSTLAGETLAVTWTGDPMVSPAASPALCSSPFAIVFIGGLGGVLIDSDEDFYTKRV